MGLNKGNAGMHGALPIPRNDMTGKKKKCDGGRFLRRKKLCRDSLDQKEAKKVKGRADGVPPRGRKKKNIVP